MKRSKLISMDSPVYMKRVVREVRRQMLAAKRVMVRRKSTPDGFSSIVRGVRIKNFAIQVLLRPVSSCVPDIRWKVRIDKWFDMPVNALMDEYYQDIVASQTERNNDGN